MFCYLCGFNKLLKFNMPLYLKDKLYNLFSYSLFDSALDVTSSLQTNSTDYLVTRDKWPHLCNEQPVNCTQSSQMVEVAEASAYTVTTMTTILIHITPCNLTWQLFNEIGWFVLYCIISNHLGRVPTNRHRENSFNFYERNSVNLNYLLSRRLIKRIYLVNLCVKTLNWSSRSRNRAKRLSGGWDSIKILSL